jgi:glycosyltransferase involved in cell wall biosynthesis
VLLVNLESSGSSGAEISVVIASVESEQSIPACLESVRTAVGGLRAEVFVVDASRDPSASIAEKYLGDKKVLRREPGTLTPELWATGIRETTGRVVVLTTAHFSVEPVWAVSLSSVLDETEIGAAGSLELADETSITDWAVFYLRYSEFFQEPEQIQRGVPGIPADNAAYSGDAIRRFVNSSPDGFWEVEFHRQMHAAGKSLAFVPGATARYCRSFPFLTIADHRFHHGRHSGAWRVSRNAQSAARVVFATPVVPFALALRVWRRVRPVARHRQRFLRSLPVFLVLATMWALGEAVGALAGAPSPRRAAPVTA